MNLNPLAWSFRAQMLFGAFVSAALIAYALYVEHGMLMLPCPLCIYQRIAFVLVGSVGLVAALHSPKGRLMRGIYGYAAFFLALLGAGVAARHLWLQMQPPSGFSSCGGVGLEHLFKSLDWVDALAVSLSGSADCAKVDWSLFGLSMPGWTLICYSMLALGALCAARNKR